MPQRHSPVSIRVSKKARLYFALPANLLGGLSALLLCACGPAAEPAGDSSVVERCVVCHSLEKGGPFRVAPNLWNIVGAEKARDRAWYAYSPALIRKGGTWTPEELDRFLSNPDEYAPGTTMTLSVPDDAERKAIIEFLKTLN